MGTGWGVGVHLVWNPRYWSASHMYGVGFAVFWSRILKLGIRRAPEAQCARSATIWACGRSRNPYCVVLWASLLFGSRF